jgi:hypothetical protein
MSEYAERNFILLCAKPRLGEIHARVVGRLEVNRALIDHTAEGVTKNESSVQRAREKVAQCRLHLERRALPRKL